MERRKLTKEDLDKVRHIEGFPIGKDEDIIALSDAPYYTACPNPFIEDFIRENGTPYDEATDDYHREPFAADVSEGKHDPLYMAHSYHTKVPYKAIMRYILNYTSPGEIVFDGFCGTGMTGVAAQMCGSSDAELRLQMEKTIPNAKWGKRQAILNDLSTEATFIASNYNTSADVEAFRVKAVSILGMLKKEYGWVYETSHQNGYETIEGFPIKGDINYTIWSDVYICPNCGKELCYWDISVTTEESIVDKPTCPDCGYSINKDECDRAITTFIDEKTQEVVSVAKQVPVRIAYTLGKKRFTKKPDQEDIKLIEKINNLSNDKWYPTDLMMRKGENWGDSWRAGYHFGMTRVHQFYSRRNLYILSQCYDYVSKEENKRIKSLLLFWLSSIYSRSHKLNRYMPNHHRHVGPLSGTLYIPFFQAEINIIDLLEEKLKSITELASIRNNSLVSTQSSTDLNNIPSSTIDYIFTDPPFGDNLNYSELNFIQESWLKVITNNDKEAVINSSQGKALPEYQALMQQCFCEFYRVLKPGRWITVEFHNSKNAVWNSIQETLQRAGFVVADVRTLDKQKGTTKQLSGGSTVKQDLVISAYKPRESFRKEILENAGSPETAWRFVQQHLSNLPVVVDANKDGKIDILAERQAYLLFDRMVAFHIMQGIPVPMDSSDFYRGLDERFLKRDRMYFLPEQINEYDTARIHSEVEDVQLSFIVSNEKTAISWLYAQLETPQTYAELQPKFMQEVRSIDKFEAMPELSVLLEENFLQSDDGKWYIPDITKEADMAKLREKSLLKEFDGYLATKGKLKLFRSEAIRAGFARLWKDKNYKLIVETAERLPEQVIQEDDKLLMYYDISLGRV